MEEKTMRAIEEKLQNKNEREEILNEIRDQLTSNSQLTNSLNIPLIFNCLNSQDDENLDLVVDVLGMCMSNLSVGESTNRYKQHLIDALKHHNPQVKLFALNEINRCTKNNISLELLINEFELESATIDCIADDNLSVANKASEIITTIGNTEMGLTFLLKQPLVNHINQLFKMTDVVRFRIYEVLIKISCSNESNLLALENAQWLQLILNELKQNDDDVLLQLNTIELFNNLAKCKHGREFFERHQLMHQLLVDYFSNDDDNQQQLLLLPGLIKFFGNLIYFEPLELLNKYPSFLNVLFDLNKWQTDAVLSLVIIETIAHIGSTNVGKIALNTIDNNLCDLLKWIGEQLLNQTTDWRVRILEAIQLLLHIPMISSNSQSSVQINREQLEQITHKWYNYLIANAPHCAATIVFDQAKSPFLDIRLAALSVINAISSQHWAQQLITSKSPGFIEYLLDRNETHTKQIKQVKYEILLNLQSSYTTMSSTNLTNTHAQLIEKYIKEGPFYVNVIQQVAFESSK